MLTPIEDTNIWPTDEKVYCAADFCDAEAAFVIERTSTPICECCKQVFEWGASNAEEDEKDRDNGTDFERLSNYKEKINNGTAIALIWTVEDIMDRAEETGKKISEELAIDILYAINHRHDACIGVNWDVLDVHIDEAVSQRESANA